MKLVHKFALIHGVNFVLLVVGALHMSGWGLFTWLLLVGVAEFVEFWILFIHPMELILSDSDHKFSGSLGFTEFNEVASMLSNLSSDLKSQKEARLAAAYLSEHDGLTNCFNRIRLNSQMDYYNSCNELCVMMFDVNNLKRMNDEHGHKAGDALIKTAVEQLKYWNSYGDLYRVGGDEFLVVLCDKSKDLCDQLFRDWNGNNVILNRIDDGFRCILSCGVAYGKDMDKLMKLADARMYENKRSLKEEFGEEVR